MADIINCPSCQRRLHLPDDSHGKTVRCPSCQAEFTANTDIPTVVLADEPAPAPRPPRSTRRSDRDDDPRDEDRRRRPVSRRPPPRRMSAAKKILLVVVCVLGAGLIYGLPIYLELFRDNATSSSPVRPIANNPQPLPQPMRPVIHDNKPLAEEEIARQLKPLFDEMGAALNAHDPDRVMANYDIDRMAGEIGPLVGLRLDDPRQRQEAVSGLRAGLGKRLAGPQPFMQWVSSDIRSVKKLNNDEAVAIVRHKHPISGTVKMRWWVSRQSGTWKIYDMEFLDAGLRMSVATASVVAQGGNFLEIRRAVQALQDAVETLVFHNNVDGAERKLQSIAQVKLPREADALRFVVQGRIDLARGQPQAALKAFDAAHDLHPDMPVVDFLKGLAYSQLKKWDQAIKHFQAYRDVIGDDGEVCHELAIALRNANRFAEAAKVYRADLDLDPKDEIAFEGLLSSILPQNNLDDLGERFLKLDGRRDLLLKYAADCERRDLIELMGPLARAMQKADPQYPMSDYYLALIEIHKQHVDRAIPLFQSFLARQRDAALRASGTQGFLQAMQKVGKLADGYAAVPDSRGVFRFAAAEGLKSYRLDDLKRLLAIHRKNDAADPLLAWYQAAVYVREQRYTLADRTFTAALGAPPDAQTLESFRADRVTARYHSGLALAAYRDIRPQDETFKQLASLAWEDEDDALLQKLLDLHEKNDPQSMDLLRYRCRLKVRQGQLDDGIALFRKGLERLAANKDQSGEWVSEFLAEMMAAGKVVEGYRAAPDARIAFTTLADDLLEEDRLDELRRLIEVHRQNQADDPSLALYQGDIDLADKAWDKAADGLLAGLKAAPKATKERFRWKAVLACYRAGRWKQAYEKVSPHEKTFTQLANLMEQDKKINELELLCQAHQGRGADSADWLFYLSLTKVLRKQPAEAADFLGQTYRKQEQDYLRRNYVARFLGEMQEQGLMMEGYRAAPDKSAAFETLAAGLVAKKNAKELATLLSEHEAGHPNDRWCDYYRGEWHLLRGEADLAAQRFAAALKKSGPEDVWRARNGLFRARVKNGHALLAYREIEPRAQNFTDLAGICVQQKDAAQLRSLIEAHQKDNPEDIETARWELDYRWLKQDYEGVLKLLKENGEDYFDLPRNRWKANDYRVRSLVKLKRTEEALRAAEALVKRRGNRLLLVLACAATGDVKRAIAVVEQPKTPSYLVGNCYRDASLGPILRGEAFRAFREKYPEPK